MDIYEDEMRGLVESELPEPFAQQAWDHWMYRTFPDWPNDRSGNVAADARAVVDVIDSARKYMPASASRKRERPADETAMEPEPDWWRQFIHDLIEPWRGPQAAVRRSFGLDSPMTREEADALIEELAGSQSKCGETRELTYEHFHLTLTPAPTRRTQTVYRGDSGNPAPLYELSVMAGLMATRAGCEEHEAVSFLLCDMEPWFPLIRVRLDLSRPASLIEIRIGTPAVSVSEVAAEYVRFLKHIAQVDPMALELGPKRRRKSRQRTIQLLAFVDAEQPGKKTADQWKKLRDQWNRRQIDKWHYPTWAAMREAYRRAKLRGGGEDGR